MGAQGSRECVETVTSWLDSTGLCCNKIGEPRDEPDSRVRAFVTRAAISCLLPARYRLCERKEYVPRSSGPRSARRCHRPPALHASGPYAIYGSTFVRRQCTHCGVGLQGKAGRWSCGDVSIVLGLERGLIFRMLTATNLSPQRSLSSLLPPFGVPFWPAPCGVLGHPRSVTRISVSLPSRSPAHTLISRPSQCHWCLDNNRVQV